MRQQSPSEFVFLGTALRYLMHVEAGWQPRSDSGAVYNYEKLLESCSQLGLLVTRGVIYHELHAIMKRFKRMAKAYVMTEEDANSVSNAAASIRTTMLAESDRLRIFVAEPRRYEIELLVDRPEDLFGGGVFGALSDMAKFDFTQGARCLAYGLPTAAAFHSLRATEDVLRGFYEDWVRTKRIKSPRMWGPMIGDLRTRRTKPPDGLMNNLDNIRIHFRNPTQHPDKTYDLDEADDLWGLCVEVVNRMRRSPRP